MAESIFSQMGAVIHTSLNSLKTELQGNVSDVQTSVDSNTTDIAGLTTDIANETSRATSAETNLQLNITAEADTRSSADTTLQTNIDNEVSRAQAAEATLSSSIDGKFDSSGGEVTGHILPANDITYDLGSPQKMWRDVYVGPGSLYVNGQKVLEENAGTITISADDDQNVQIKTGGGGDIEFYPSGTGNIDMKGNLSIQAGKKILSGDGQPIDIQPGVVNLGLTGDTTANNLTINGNLVVNGTTTTVNTETLNIADNIITLNSNAIGSPTENAGLIIERGDSADSQIIWNETDDEWQLSSDSVTFKRIVIEGDITTSTLGLDNVDNTSDANKPISNSTQTVLNTKLNLTGGTISGAISFGAQTRQMLNLFNAEYGIGVQNATTYFRSATNFAWYAGGIHSSAEYAPGQDGVELMRLSSTEFKYKGDTVWTTGNVGPGSGLDADTVDGLDANAFELAGGQSRSVLNDGSDLNDVATGWYSWGSGANQPANAPFTYANMLQLNDSNQKIQLAFGGTSSGKLAIRRADSGTFYDWTHFATDDANTLDGLDSTQFARTDVDTVINAKVTINSTQHGALTVNKNDSEGDGVVVRVENDGVDEATIRFRNSGVGHIDVGIGSSNEFIIKAPHDNTVGSSYDFRFTGLQAYINGNEVLTTASTTINADTLDSLNSTQFLRSDVSDSMTGDMNVSGLINGRNVSNDGTNLDALVAEGASSYDQSLNTTDDVQFNDVIVDGNLTVSGTTTTVDTETLTLADNIITLNSNATGTPTEDAGIDVERGDSTDARLVWVESADKWACGLAGATKYIALESTNVSFANVTSSGNIVLGSTVNTALTLGKNVLGGTEISFNAALNAGRTTYATDAYAYVGVTATTGGSYPFDGAGHLVLQSRGSVDRDIVFVTGSTPTNRMVVDGATGNVGIGTTNPDTKLEVVGASAGIGDTNGIIKASVAEGDQIQLGVDATNSFAWIRSAHPGVGWNDLALQPDGGNVGIGTTSPGEKFHIDSTGSDTRMRINADAGFDTEIKFYNNGASQYTIGHDDGTDNFVIGTTNVDTPKVSITKAGNVGIGVEVPGALLDIKKTDGVNYTASTDQRGKANIIVRNDNEGVNEFSSMSLITGGGNQSEWSLNNVWQANYSGKLAFKSRIGGSTWAEQVTFLANGNVGIGTTNPGAKLDVAGTAEINGTTTIVNSDLIFSESSKNLYIGYNSVLGGNAFNIGTNTAGGGAPITIFSNSNAGLTVATNGNVGIGTTAPGAKLEVYNGTMIFNGGTNPSITLNEGANNAARISHQGGYSTGYLQLQDYSAGWVNPGLVIKQGNVGIGTTAPTEKLHIDNRVSGSYGVARIAFNSGDSAGLWNGGFLQYIKNASQDQMEISLGGTTNPELTIQNGGNVGIGTTAPGAKLQVSSAASISVPTLSVNLTSSAGAANYAYSTAALNPNMVVNENVVSWVGQALNAKNAGYIGFNYQGAGSTSNYLTLGLYQVDHVLNITGAGNVGIGTTNPSAPLHVNGDIRVSSNPYGMGIKTVGGLSATSIFANADYGNHAVSLGKQTAAGTYTSYLIATNGKVGIGTTAPGQKLEVVGRIRATSGSNYGELFTGSSGGLTATHLGSISNIPLAFYTNSSAPKVTIDTSGNVGIGTTAPGAKLEVDGGNILLGNNWGFNMENTSGVARTLIRMGSDDNVYLRNNGTQEVMTLDQNGNVGIGTTAPIYKLNVISGSAWNTTHSYASFGSNGDARHLVLGNYYTGSDAYSYIQARYDVGDVTVHPLLLNPYGGNVGIGTTVTGNYKLNVNGTIKSNNGFTSYVADGLFGATAVPGVIKTPGSQSILFGYTDVGGGQYSPRIGFIQSGSATAAKASIGLETNGKLSIGAGASNATAVTIDQSGNVGIGTTNPLFKLHVSGTSRFESEMRWDLGTWTSHAGYNVNKDWYIRSGEAAGKVILQDNGGNVGIGTTAPGAKLQVSSAASISVPTLSVNLTSSAGAANYAYSTAALNPNMVVNENVVSWVGQALNAKNAGYIGFNYQGAGSTSNYLTLGLYQVDHVLNITGAGNVGIGTTAPGALLTLAGADPTLRIDGTSSEGLQFYRSGVQKWNLSSLATSANLALWNNVTGSYSLAVESATGNVGIGTTGPLAKLEVVGGANRTGYFGGDNGTQETVYIQRTDTSGGSADLLSIVANQGASSDFHLARYYANAGTDPKFQFRADGYANADGTWSSTGGDYAEYFEWEDGNVGEEDRRGISVTLVNGKIREALEGETIIGVVSATASVVGDDPYSNWKDKYLTDDYGSPVMETVDVYEWTEEVEDGDDINHSYEFDKVPEGVTVPEDKTIISIERNQLNPVWDENLDYANRGDRPEWDVIGLMGKIRVRVGQQHGPNWIKIRDISANVEEYLVR